MNFHAIIGNYYGLDWGVLMFGLISTVLMTQGNLKLGMKISLLTCTCGLTCALLSGQNGFIVYNTLLILVNARGLIRGDRRTPVKREVSVANDDSSVTQPGVLVRVRAR